MIELKGFYDVNVLQELLYNEKITWMEYIYHHSQEKIDAFNEFCREKGLQENEESASAFCDYELKCEEKAHTDSLD